MSQRHSKLRMTVGAVTILGAVGCELIAGLGDHELASANGASDSSLEGASAESGAPGFSLTAEPSVTLLPGANAAVTITVTRTGGFSDVVNLSASGLPSTATSNTASVTSDTSNGSLSITVAASAPQSLTHMTINGVSGDGKINASTPLDLLVRGPSGSLDSLFGNQGVATNFTTGTQVNCSNVKIDAAGRIVILGNDGYTQGVKFKMLRLTADGALDTTFASTGIITHTFDFTPNNFAALALFDAGTWDVAGNTGPPAGPYSAIFAHVLDNGLFDTSYSLDGGAGNSYSMTVGQMSSFAIDPSGRVYGAGGTTDSPAKLHIERRLPSGAPDGTFSAADQAFGTGSAYPSGIAIQGDGKIVALFNGADTGGTGIAFARYTTSGALDSTFGVGGYVAPSATTAGPDGAQNLVIQSDGNILAVGPSDMSALLARFKPNGTLDSFGPTGMGTALLPTGIASVAEQSDGKILVSFVANVDTDAGPTTAIGLMRLTSGGLVDSSFGDAGTVTTQLPGEGAYAGPIAIEPDGRIVVCGIAFTSGDTTDFDILRYWP